MVSVGSPFPLPDCPCSFTDCGFAVMAHNGPPRCVAPDLIVPLQKQERPELVPRQPVVTEHLRAKGNRASPRIVCEPEPTGDCSMTNPQKPATEPLDISDEDVARFETDSELKNKDTEIDPDESM